MKVIQIMPEFALAGAETMCANLSISLKKLGVDVVVVSLFNYHSSITDKLENSGIKVIFLNKKSGLNLGIVKQLRKVFKQEKPDVIHTHRYILKYVFLAAIGLGIPKVHTVHNVAQKELGKIDRIINKTLFKLKLAFPVALSNETNKSIVDVYKIKNIPTVLNGIALENCIVKEDYSGMRTIIHIGRFAYPKNHISLIKAAELLHEKHPDVVFKLVGAGELEREIKGYVSEHNMNDYIEFVGLLDNVYPILNESDIFVLPSNSEGIPMSIIEAMGTGLPVVASAVGGIPDMITDGKDGLLCEPTADSTAEKLDMLITDARLREKLGKNAVSSAVRFSADTMADKYLNIYKQHI